MLKSECVNFKKCRKDAKNVKAPQRRRAVGKQFVLTNEDIKESYERRLVMVFGNVYVNERVHCAAICMRNLSVKLKRLLH